MRWLRHPRIRTRITLQTLVVALLLCSLAAVLFRLNVESVVTSSTDQLLLTDAGSYEAAIQAQATAPKFVVGEDELVAVIAPDGSVAVSTLPPQLRERMSTLERLRETSSVVSGPGYSYRARLETVASPAGEWKIISARSEQAGNLVIGSLSTALVIGDIILVLAFTAAAWALTGAALRPVRQMREDAERLGAARSPGLLPVSAAADELSELATTLNTFLDGNRRAIEREKQLLSDSNHELRTPLAILRAQLELAASPHRTEEELREEIAAARTTAVRLTSLTTNLLELARVESSAARQLATPSQLIGEVAASVDRARVLAQPRGVLIEFDVEMENDEQRTLRASAVEFASVLDNLLSNALTASLDGATVHLLVQFAEMHLVCEVRDSGHGMPPDFLPVAFERFSRPDASRQRQRGGTGLGLAIVHAIATAAGGAVTLQNLDPGLCVRVTMPLSP